MIFLAKEIQLQYIFEFVKVTSTVLPDPFFLDTVYMYIEVQHN